MTAEFAERGILVVPRGARLGAFFRSAMGSIRPATTGSGGVLLIRCIGPGMDALVDPYAGNVRMIDATSVGGHHSEATLKNHRDRCLGRTRDAPTKKSMR